MGEADDPRGRLVRPYAVTRGRTEPGRDIAIEALLQTSERGQHAAQHASQHPNRDQRRIVNLCRDRPQSLAEISAHLGLPLGVVRVLVADMISADMLVLHDVADGGNIADRIDVLERVLVGLHRL